MILSKSYFKFRSLRLSLSVDFPLGSFDRLLQILNDVVRMLDSDGEAQQTIVDSDRSPYFLRNPLPMQ